MSRGKPFTVRCHCDDKVIYDNGKLNLPNNWDEIADKMMRNVGEGVSITMTEHPESSLWK